MDRMVEEWAGMVDKDVSLRERLAGELPSLFEAVNTRPAEVYKLLKYVCTLGTRVQDEIRTVVGPLKQPLTGIDQFIQFLNNFAVGNETNQLLVWPIATEIHITTERELRLYLMLLSNLVAADRSRGDWFVKTDEGKAFLSFVLTKIEMFDDATFEWAFLLSRGVIPGRMQEALAEAKDRGQEVILLNYVDSLLLKSWESDTSLFSLTESDLHSLIQCVQSTPQSSPPFPLLLSILEVSIRPGFRSQSLQSLYQQSLIPFVYSSLSSLAQISANESVSGLKTVILQLICNQIEDFPASTPFALDNLYLLLSCTKVDVENLYMREWVVLILKFLVKMCPETEGKIRALEAQGVSEEAKRMKIELDPSTMRPRYRK